MPDVTQEAWLVRDERHAMGIEPGLHALLIGVSEYIHLPEADEPAGEGFQALQKLQFAARSAFKLSRKLDELNAQRRLHRPIKTMRLLIAPSKLELEKEPGLPDFPPTLKNLKRAVRAWREDLSMGPEEMGLFYFVGHGIRHTPDESILLASDFLENEEDEPLSNAFAISSISGGMAPSQKRPNISRHQYYFVDACRETSKPLLALVDRAPPPLLSPVINKDDDRCAPIYLASPPGGVAEGVNGEQSAFIEALLWALDHGSPRSELRTATMRKEWPVKASSIKNALRCFHPKFDRSIDVRGVVSESTLCYAVDPPQVTVRIDFKPAGIEEAVAGGHLHPVIGKGPSVAFLRTNGDPCAIERVPAGVYQLEVDAKDRLFESERQDPELISVDLPVPWAVKVGR